MQIKKQTLFRFDSLLWGDYIWMCVSILPTLVCARAVYYNYHVLKTGLPTGAWATMLTTLTAFWGITVLRYIGRARFIKSILFYTRQGLTVSVPRPKARERVNQYVLDAINTKLSDAIDRALDFWAKKAGVLLPNQQAIPNKTELAKGLNGGCLTITDAPFSAQSTHGPMPPNFPQKLMGLNYLDQFIIAWDGDRVQTLEQLCGLLEHEISHFALFQLSIDDPDGTRHHQLMVQHNFDH